MSDFCGTLLMFLAACSYGAAAIAIKLAYHAGLQAAGGVMILSSLVLMQFPGLRGRSDASRDAARK
jgi:hypothetical protein